MLCHRTIRNVKDGDYTCYAWRFLSDTYNENGEVVGRAYNRVGIIGMYLDGVIPREKDMEPLFIIGVDSGLAGFFVNKPDYSDEQWNEICQQITKGFAWMRPEGVFSQSGYGDGEYSVYGYRDSDGKITALEIRFI